MNWMNIRSCEKVVLAIIGDFSKELFAWMSLSISA